MLGIASLVAAIIFNALGNFLLKVGADKGTWLNIELVLGVFFFSLNVLFYIAALRLLPLSVAYPAMVGAVFILVGSAAAIILHEHVSWLHLVGYVLIVGGIVIVSALGPRVA